MSEYYERARLGRRKNRTRARLPNIASTRTLSQKSPSRDGSGGIMEKPGSVIICEPQSGLFEVICDGFVAAEYASYLKDLEKRIRYRPDIKLLFSALTVTGFAAAFPMAHVAPFRRWLGQVGKIAVTHRMPSIGVAVSTVRLA